MSTADARDAAHEFENTVDRVVAESKRRIIDWSKWLGGAVLAVTTFGGYSYWNTLDSNIRRKVDEKVDAELPKMLDSRKAEVEALQKSIDKLRELALLAHIEAIKQSAVESQKALGDLKQQAEAKNREITQQAEAENRKITTKAAETLARLNELLAEAETEQKDVLAHINALELSGRSSTEPLRKKQGDVENTPQRPWAFREINLAAAQADAAEGQPLTVAVLANGFAPPEEFKGRFLPGENFVPGESLDDDGLGYGTNLATLIAQIAPKVRILPVKVMSNSGTGSSSTILRGLEYTIERKARIAVLAFSLPPNTPDFLKMFRKLEENNSLPIISAGNDRSVRIDRSLLGQGALLVAAVGPDLQLAPFSNFGDIAAPGVDVWTVGPDAKTVTMSGTGPSCAIASGVAALVLSVRPDSTNREVRSILEESARRIPPKGAGAGLVDAAAAVRQAKALPEDKPQ